jgi:hypothetical protein
MEMGVLAMLELEGDTAALMAASDELERRLPQPDGLLVRILAPTESGVVLLQLWESAEARQRNADDPAHAEALAASGIQAVVRGSRSRVFDAAELTHVAELGAG